VEQDGDCAQRIEGAVIGVKRPWRKRHQGQRIRQTEFLQGPERTERARSGAVIKSDHVPSALRVWRRSVLRCASSSAKSSIMTWSIVAFDSATGAFGAAVATKAFASGSFVPFVRAGVGAV